MTSSSMLSLELPAYMLTDDDLIAHRARIRDITADADNRFFRKIPTGSQVDLKHCCNVGKQGCGKTWLENYRLWTAFQKYGEKNVNAIYTDDPRVFLDRMDDRPVQFAIIDDATSHASSREVHKQIEVLKTFNKSRHVYEKHLQGKPGLLLYDWCWQRWIELDPGFRDGHLLLFKTGMTGSQDRRDINDKLGDAYTSVLDQIWDRIDRGDNDVKRLSVARISSQRPDSGGVGLYVSRDVEWVLPDMITSEDYFGAVEEQVDVLEKYRDDPKWSKRIQCYELYITGKFTQHEVAEQMGISRQGYVSDSVRKVKELLST